MKTDTTNRMRPTITGKMMARKVDFRIQRTAKQTIWTRVKRWTRLRGTWRRKEKSGWCLGGIRYNLIRSQNWNRKMQNRFSGVLSLYKCQYNCDYLEHTVKCNDLLFSPPVPPLNCEDILLLCLMWLSIFGFTQLKLCHISRSQLIESQICVCMLCVHVNSRY